MVPLHVFRRCASIVLTCALTQQGAHAVAGVEPSSWSPRASTATATLHPGSLFMFEDPTPLRPAFKGYCTLNFLFSGSDGSMYMGTAGHCQPEAHTNPEDAYSPTNSDRSWPAGQGPVAMDTHGNRIGEFAYYIQNAPETAFSAINGPGNRRLPVGDFALIRLDANVGASPSVCHFGGPWGVFTDTPSRPLEMRMYGNGYGLGYNHTTESPLPAAARPLVATTGAPNKEYIFADTAFSVSDSGSPVLTVDGKAIGVFSGVWEGYRVQGGIEAGSVIIARIQPLRRAAEKKLGISLDLERAKATADVSAVPNGASKCG